MHLSGESWGLAGDRPARLWTLQADCGLVVRISDYGGVIQSLEVPDRDGRPANVVLGYPALADYVHDFEQQPWPAPGGSGSTYFGALVGRYANRIAGHCFELDGERHELTGNNGPGDVHTLHGGPRAWNAQVWHADELRAPRSVGLRLSLTEPDGYNGFPGEVRAEVTYSLNARGALRIDYRASASRPTVLSPTNHSYFNLAGESSGSVGRQLLRIAARRFAPVDDTAIPVGELRPVPHSPFDFHNLKPIGRDIRRTDLPSGEQLALAHGYDHGFVLDGSGMRLAAVAVDPDSGRQLLLYTSAPSLQLYTANYLAGDLVGSGGRAYRQGDGFCLETGHLADSPHHDGEPGWPSAILRPGRPFRSSTIFRFGCAGA